MASAERVSPGSETPTVPGWWRGLARWAPAILMMAAALAYANSFRGQFTFDDFGSIEKNASIRHLWPPWDVLTYRSGGETASARPVLNFSLAVNYAVSGTEIWSYHALNLLIHLGAGLFLWGIAWRTWCVTGGTRGAAGISSEAPGGARGPLTKSGLTPLQTEARVFGLVVALLWLLHPVQTQAVTYVVQRAESMMGLFFLGSLYGLVRAAGNPSSRVWPAFSVGMCLLGTGTKEVIAMAPPVLLLFDRVYLAGGFREAWNRRRALHVGLFATWIPLAGLVLSNGGNRGGSMGYDIGLDAPGHLLAQLVAVVRYAKLSLWPSPLVFDYGLERFSGIQLALSGLLVLGILALLLRAWRRRPALAFPGLWFLAILAPSSLVPSLTQTTAEHRLYLSLAGIVVLVVTGLWRWLGPRFAAAGLVLVFAAGVATHVRNRFYALDSAAFWAEVVRQKPTNAHAQYNLGVGLMFEQRFSEALAPLEYVLQHDQRRNTLAAHNNYATALVHLGRKREAIRHFHAASANLDDGTINYNLGLALMEERDFPQALNSFEESTRRNPKLVAAWNMQGVCLVGMGQVEEGIRRYEEALKVEPAAHETLNNLGLALMRLNRLDEAATRFEAAALAKPDSAEVHANLGIVRARSRQFEESARHFRESLRLKPDDVATRSKLGVILAELGQADAALAELNAVVRSAPGDLAAHATLAALHAAAGRPAEAARHREIADRLRAGGGQ